MKLVETIEKKDVLVIDNDGANLGIMSIRKALEVAENKSLDLVYVNDTTCKIMDYKKAIYDQKKKAEENKPKQIENGEVRLSYRIQKHDLEIKAKTVQRLIENGQNVIINLRLKGRENSYYKEATGTVNELIEMCSEFAQVKKAPVYNEKLITAMLEPKKEGK